MKTKKIKFKVKQVVVYRGKKILDLHKKAGIRRGLLGRIVALPTANQDIPEYKVDFNVPCAEFFITSELRALTKREIG